MNTPQPQSKSDELKRAIEAIEFARSHNTDHRSDYPYPEWAIESLIYNSKRVEELEKDLKQERIWKEEDPRMLREQMRVHDVAFQNLFEEKRQLEKERFGLSAVLRGCEAVLKETREERDEALLNCKLGIESQTKLSERLQRVEKQNEQLHDQIVTNAANHKQERDALRAELKVCAKALVDLREALFAIATRQLSIPSAQALDVQCNNALSQPITKEMLKAK